MNEPKDVKDQLKKFILKKVRESVSIDKPYFIIKWSGLFELCRSMGQDLLEIIDQMDQEGIIKKALIKTKKGRKLLAVTLPELPVSSKNKKLLEEFLEFVKEEE